MSLLLLFGGSVPSTDIAFRDPVFILKKKKKRIDTDFATGMPFSQKGNTVAVGQVTEVDEAQPITRSGVVVNVFRDPIFEQKRSRPKRSDAITTGMPFAQKAAGPVAIGQATETDLAQSITRSGVARYPFARIDEPFKRKQFKRYDLDSSRFYSFPTNITIGQAEETDEAQPITIVVSTIDVFRDPIFDKPAKKRPAPDAFIQTMPFGQKRAPVAVNQVTETDLAQPLSIGGARYPFARILETNRKKAAVRSTEVLPRGFMSAARTVAVGQVSETDLSQPISRIKTKAIGQNSETDLAQVLTRRKTKAIGENSETDLAQPIVRLKTKAIGETTEVDSTFALTHLKAKLLGQNSETDLAQFLTLHGSTAVNQVAETDTAQPITKQKRKTLLQTSETDSAQTVRRIFLKAVGLTSETDLAESFGHSKNKAIGQNTEVDTCQIVRHVKLKTIGQPAETDSVQAVFWIHRRFVLQAEETDFAQFIITQGSEPTIPGLEFTSAENRMHFTSAESRMHYTAADEDA